MKRRRTKRRRKSRRRVGARRGSSRTRRRVEHAPLGTHSLCWAGSSSIVLSMLFLLCGLLKPLPSTNTTWDICNPSSSPPSSVSLQSSARLPLSFLQLWSSCDTLTYFIYFIFMAAFFSTLVSWWENSQQHVVSPFKDHIKEN